MKVTLKQIFKQGRIIGFAGERNSGKTNNLAFLISEFRKHSDAPIFFYGFDDGAAKYLKSLKCREISSLRQMVKKKDCILIIDEMQKLKLNDRRYTEIKDEFSDYVYHNNVYTILSSPNIREFNSVIGSIIDGWMLKSIDIRQCVNGSQLKQAVDEYKGGCKKLGCIEISNDKLLLINDTEDIVISCDYIGEADTKRNQRDLFLSGKSQEKVESLKGEVRT